MHSKREYFISEESKILGPQTLEAEDLSTELKEIAIFRKKKSIIVLKEIAIF